MMENKAKADLAVKIAEDIKKETGDSYEVIFVLETAASLLLNRQVSLNLRNLERC